MCNDGIVLHMQSLHVVFPFKIGILDKLTHIYYNVLRYFCLIKHIVDL